MTEMATADETRAVFAQIDAMLQLQAERIQQIGTVGSLTPAQQRYVGFALDIADGLRQLFQREAARQFGDEG